MIMGVNSFDNDDDDFFYSDQPNFDPTLGGFSNSELQNLGSRESVRVEQLRSYEQLIPNIIIFY
jgi:hypothetical protein